MRAQRHLGIRVALLGAVLALAPGASASAQTRVLVAVLPFQVSGARDAASLERELADQLAERLEASGKVQVVDRVVVREALVAHVSGERSEEMLRDMARKVGAQWVVSGSLTELAGAYSLDVRVAPADEAVPAKTLAYTAKGADELRNRVDGVADRVLEIVAGGPPPGAPTGAPVVEVQIQGDGIDPDQIRRDLRVRPGRPFEEGALEADLARLRKLPGVAAADARVDRSGEGVVVTYQLTAAAPSPEVPAAGGGGGERIAEIRIAGNRRIEADAIRARIASKAGERYDPARVAEDVRQIYALGFFSDVRVVSERAAGGRVLIFEIQENPVVRQITIAGNEALDSDRIRDQLTLTTGATLDLPLLYENRDRIEALYRAEGYYQAKVSYEVDTLPNDAVAVNFEVREGKKLRLTEIRFEGNEHFTQSELQKGMRTKPWHWYSYATRYLDKSGTYAEPVFLQDMQGVERKYTDAGFLRVELSEPEVSAEGEQLIVTVKITEGDRYKVGKLEVSGDPTVTIEEVRPEFALANDEWFNRSHLTQDVEKVTRRYTDRGFYYASVNPLTDIDETTKTVDVTFDVQKGPLYFVRQIDIAGNTRTVDRVIRREIQVVEGQLYSARALQNSKSRLDGTGYFEEVTFEPQRTEKPDELDLDVNVVEKSTGAISFGAGYSTSDGVVLSSSVNQNNLFGRGISVRVAGDYGGQRDRFYAQVSDRRFLDSEFSLTGTAFRTDVSYEDFEETSTGGDLTLGRSLDDANRQRGFLRYSFVARSIEADSEVNATSVVFREFLTDNTTTSLLGLSFRMDTRNDQVLPTDGFEAGVSLDGAGLGGFTKFARVEARAALYQGIPKWLPIPLAERSSVVLAARVGYTLPFNDISDYEIPDGPIACINSESCPLDAIDDDLTLPLTERYFMGGLGSFQLRGYEARTVGPRRSILYEGTGLGGGGNGVFRPNGVNAFGECPQGDCNSLDDKDYDDFDDIEDTDVVGGSQFISLTAEYRFPISEQLGLIGIAFLDMGNAFAEDQFLFDFSQWKFGTGAGVLWFSPFGPLQAFLGFPINPLEVDKNMVFEFSVGGSAL